MGGTGSDGGGVSGEEEGSNVIQDIPRKGRDEDSPICIPFARRKGWFSLLDWVDLNLRLPKSLPLFVSPPPLSQANGLCKKKLLLCIPGESGGEWSLFFPSCFIRGISNDACKRNIFWR